MFENETNKIERRSAHESEREREEKDRKKIGGEHRESRNF